MKKILSLALVISLMLGTVAVKAQTQTTDLVPLYNFDTLAAGTIDDAGLSALGITADTTDKAVMSVVDLSADATYGNLKKVLKYDATAANSSIKFPISYELNANEKMVVEYDFKFEAEYAGADGKDDCFASANFGTIGLLPIQLMSGGNGWVFQAYSSASAKRMYFTMFDTRDTASNRTPEDWLHVRVEYDYGAYQADSTQGAYITVDDLASGSRVKSQTGHLTGTTLTDLTFAETAGKGQVYLDNIHVYTMPKLKLTDSSITAGAENVFYDTEKITFSFNNTIADVSAVTVSKDGAQMPEGSYTVTPSGNSVVIAFTEDLSFGSSYTVDLAGVTDDLGQTLGEKTISFTVESEPDVRLGELKLIKGIGGASQTVSEFTAANGLQTISLKLENLKSEPKDVNVMFAIYEASNRRFVGLRNVVTNIPANETRTVYIGSDMTDLQGKIVKAFVWESWSTLRPWFGGVELEVK